MDPDVVIAILKSLPAPAALAVVVLGISWWRAGRRAAQAGAPSPGPTWAAGIAIPGAVVLGYWMQKLGGWSLPPRESMHWIPVIAGVCVPAAGVAWLIDRRPGGRSGIRWMARVGFGLLVSAAVGWKFIHSSLDGTAWVGGLGIAVALAWGSLDRLMEVGGPAATPGWGGAAVLGAWTGLVSQALLASDSLALGELAAMIGAGAGAAFVLAFILPRLSLAGGGAASATLLTGVLVFLGHQLAGLKLWMLVLLLLAPVLAAVIDAAVLRRLTGWKRTAGRLAGISVLPGVVLAVAIPEAIRAAGEY